MSITGLWPLDVGGFQEATVQKTQCGSVTVNRVVAAVHGPGRRTPSCQYQLHQESFA